MNIEVRLLLTLVAVAEEGTFTDAAIRLGVSQAAVSRAIARLESIVARRLVDRTTRYVTLTAAGTRAIEHARAIIAEMDALERTMSTDQGQLRLGYAWAALGRYTTDVLAAWQGLHPGTELSLVLTSSRTAGLLERRCDAAVMRRPIDDARIDGVLVGMEHRYAALPAADPLARRRRISLTDLAGRTIAVDTVTGTTSLAMWPQAARPKAIRETQGVDEWLTVIEAGMAVGITAEATRHQHPRAGVVFRRVADAAPMPVTLAWRRSDPPTQLADLIAVIVDAYAPSA